ncbi:hypothetical protein BCR36DRAFT_39006 [Piromyces finnis]|uniref:Uncharacterized protein n=1 Tax=Piromyces finnis TaxID=1754191 RepID=A0A1Y1VBK6_9FUNG|nr:hypothetical protein BCR36DRAFT_39006 [Piromyces finnis]|eukprot:ORX51854.1 hypothetical protein BCR36DRAFT_39006 [Piromyces finnis]
MNTGFDFTSQESIALANVIMENDDSNMAARALLQSWADNIPKNLSNASRNNTSFYGQRPISSSHIHRKPKIQPKMNKSHLEKLEDQLEKEKKLNKYRQEILEQKLKSDLEIYRKEYRVLRELEKRIKKSSVGSTNDNKSVSLTRKKAIVGNKSHLKVNTISMDLEDKENNNNNNTINIFKDKV